MGRRSKRRIARAIVARGLQRRRDLARAVLSGAALAIAGVAALFGFAL
jgi:hypothetical protein